MTEHNEQESGPWTEEEATAFAQKLVTFQGELPPRERGAFTAMIVAAAAQGGAGEDMRGYYWWEVLPALVDQFLKSPIGRPIDINAMVEQLRKG